MIVLPTGGGVAVEHKIKMLRPVAVELKMSRPTGSPTGPGGKQLRSWSSCSPTGGRLCFLKF